MKRILFALLLLPQLAYSQYQADCFSLDLSEKVSQTKIMNTFVRDTILTLGEGTRISGLSISGTAVLNNNNDSYIRVTLVDNYNYEFLVYESYPLLLGDLTTNFNNIALETVLLDNITPHSLKISMLNASLNLEVINYSIVSKNKRKNSNNPASIQKEQAQYIVNKLNTNLEMQNMTWRAGVTSMSEKTYSEKKDLFGGTVPVFYGFEYYVGGLYVMPGEYLKSSLKSVSSSQYVSEWDWRNRHGKNWMTSAKFHNNCGACWAFGSISTVEAYANLYYNNLINLDLSEEEILSCTQDGCSGGAETTAFNYIKNYGVVNESCFPYADIEQPCSLKCSTPNEKIYIQGYSSVSVNEDSLKSHLFKCPMTIAMAKWRHTMVVVGYKVIEIGDTIYLGNNFPVDYVIINSLEHQNLIGKTAWIFKNSWQPWGEYLSAIVDVSLSSVWGIYSLTGRITSLNYNDSDIVCEDADGDGYYFWGIDDNKPSYCPSWVPDIKDGNDANYSKGKLLLDNTPIIGELETLNPDGNSTLVISSNITYTTRQSKYSHMRITSGGKLTVKNILNLFGRVTVTIESGGELVIDGGVITNAYINLISGGKLTLKNGGKLVMRTNTDLVIPAGAFSDILHGEILRSKDY